jgi:hypothetical protein
LQDIPFKERLCNDTFLTHHPLVTHQKYQATFQKWCHDQLLYVSQKEDALAAASYLLRDTGKLELQAGYELSRSVPPMKDPNCEHPVYQLMREIVRVCSTPSQ